jgi:hypothetical protein
LCCTSHFYALDPFFLVFCHHRLVSMLLSPDFLVWCLRSAPGLRILVQPEEQAREILSRSPSSFSSGYSHLSCGVHFSSLNPADKTIIPDFSLVARPQVLDNHTTTQVPFQVSVSRSIFHLCLLVHAPWPFTPSISSCRLVFGTSSWPGLHSVRPIS